MKPGNYSTGVRDRVQELLRGSGGKPFTAILLYRYSHNCKIMYKKFCYSLCLFLTVVFLQPCSTLAGELLVPYCYFETARATTYSVWPGVYGEALVLNNGGFCVFSESGSVHYPLLITSGYVIASGYGKYHFHNEISVANKDCSLIFRGIIMSDGSVLPPATGYFHNRIHATNWGAVVINGEGGLGVFNNAVRLEQQAFMIVENQAKAIVRDKLEIQYGAQIEVSLQSDILLDKTSNTILSGFEDHIPGKPHSRIKIVDARLTIDGPITIGVGGSMHIWKGGEVFVRAPLYLQDAPDVLEGYNPKLLFGSEDEPGFSKIEFHAPITLGRKSVLELIQGRAVFHDGVRIHFPVSSLKGFPRLQVYKGAEVQIGAVELLIEQTPDFYLAPGESFWLIESSNHHLFDHIHLTSNRPLSTFSLQSMQVPGDRTGWYARREAIPGGYQSLVAGSQEQAIARQLDMLVQSGKAKEFTRSERGLLALFDRCADTECIQKTLIQQEVAIQFYLESRHLNLYNRKANGSGRDKESLNEGNPSEKKNESLYDQIAAWLTPATDQEVNKMISLSGVVACLLVMGRKQLFGRRRNRRF